MRGMKKTSISICLNTQVANPPVPPPTRPPPLPPPPDNAVRRKHEDLLLDKLHDMGVLGSASKLSAVEKNVTVSAFARRRLPVVMTRLRMAENVQAATKMIEQGHVRVGTETVTDAAYLVTRGMEDFVTWTVGSKVKRNIMKYRDQLDDFELL